MTCDLLENNATQSAVSITGSLFEITSLAPPQTSKWELSEDGFQKSAFLTSSLGEFLGFLKLGKPWYPVPQAS